jgi:hypothetical protein
MAAAPSDHCHSCKNENENINTPLNSLVHIHTVLYSFRVVHHRLCLGILYATSKSGNVLQI